MVCQFCDDVDPKRIIVKNKYAFAFPTNIPIVPGHILVCLVRHTNNIEDLSDVELKELFGLIIKLKMSLTKSFGAEGFNYAWNEGELSGQSVPHLHVHLLPRKEGDSGITEYEPRKFLYRPGARLTATPDEELQEVSELIKKNLV